MRGIDADVGRNLKLIGGMNLLNVASRAPGNAEEARAFARSAHLTLLDARALADELGFVTAALPSLRVQRVAVRGLRKEQKVELLAASARHAATFNYDVVQGRWFNEREYEGARRVCVLGSLAAERLFDAPEAALGRTLVFEKMPFTVVGIHTRDDRQSRAGELVIPYTAYAAARLPEAAPVTAFDLEIADVEHLPDAIAAVNRRLAARHRGASDFLVASNGDKYREMQRTSAGLKIVLAVIAAISLFVGMVSIMNIMFSSINDRIREVGVRKALGAQPADVFLQFIVEAVVTTLGGAGPALLMGLLLTTAPAGTFPFEPVLRSGDYLLALTFALFAGMLSGLLPALAAARMQPVEALRA
jgi:putative ABC transport system permease protein